jgi:prepilin-type N-terminal cleavage/methylation domain-containing protein
MKPLPYNTKKGFSLVEVLVAITILLLVIVSPLRMLSQANTSTSYATDQVTAFFLAQEGLELVEARLNYRMLEDFLALRNGTARPTPWATFQTDMVACIGANKCGLNPATTTIPYVTIVSGCAGNSATCQLYLNSSTAARDRFTHVAGSNLPSPFTRMIQIKVVSSGGQVEGAWATSTVTWRSAGLIADQKIELVTYLTNIYGTP